MTDPQRSGRSRYKTTDAALTAEAERIVEALEQERRAIVRPMPQLQRVEADGDSPRQR
ncbi:MAG: hypothetical protein ACUVSX_02290 [Aggregatilineales bacterium]